MAFTGFLKGNTSATLKLGPFLDSTDGNTTETALTVSQADVRLSKNGGDFAQKNDATSCTHDEIGYYDCPINTTDTNTYGRLRVAVHESGALAVVQDYLVLPEPVYDSFFPSASGSPLPVWGVLDWGTAQASASGTLVHRSALNLANDIPNGSVEQIYSGTGAGQTRVVYDFVNSTDTASISPNWVTTPDSTSLYLTFGAPPAPTNSAALPSVNVEALGGDTQSLADLKDFADAGYDPSTNKVQGVVLTDTLTTYSGNTPQTGDSYARIGATGSGLTSLASQASVDTIDNFLDTEVAAILALLDDPRGEPGQGAPPVNPDLATKIDYLYKAWRNRSTQTATTYSLYADNGTTVDQKATVSDNGTLYDRGEIATGP